MQVMLSPVQPVLHEPGHVGADHAVTGEAERVAVAAGPTTSMMPAWRARVAAEMAASIPSLSWLAAGSKSCRLLRVIVSPSET